MYICIYINIYIYRRANGIYIQKKVAAYGQFVLVFIALELNKSFVQVKYQRLLIMCGPISEIPSNISTVT